MTDALGSVLTTFNNATSSAAVQGDQVYGPFGSRRSQQGSMATTKGYTGQFADAQTGLDYYNARYYDPRVGVFLSADTVQGNVQGMDPYSYVGDNPETRNDPTGRMPCFDPSGPCGRPPTPHPGGSGGSKPPPAKPPVPAKTCGSGTYQQGNTCISNADNPANKVRAQRLSDLRHHFIVEEIAGYSLFLIGDLLLASGARSILDWLEVGIDIIATLATNIIPLIAAWSGDSIPSGVYKTISMLMGAMTTMETVVAVLKEGSWWAKEGATLLGTTIRTATSGPIALVWSVVWMFVEPVVGNLIDIGGHALLTQGFSDQAEYVREEDMPISTWCAQYGGCPTGSSS